MFLRVCKEFSIFRSLAHSYRNLSHKLESQSTLCWAGVAWAIAMWHVWPWATVATIPTLFAHTLAKRVIKFATQMLCESPTTRSLLSGKGSRVRGRKGGEEMGTHVAGHKANDARRNVLAEWSAHKKVLLQYNKQFPDKSTMALASNCNCSPSLFLPLFVPVCFAWLSLWLIGMQSDEWQSKFMDFKM